MRIAEQETLVLRGSQEKRQRDDTHQPLSLLALVQFENVTLVLGARTLHTHRVGRCEVSSKLQRKPYRLILSRFALIADESSTPAGCPAGARPRSRQIEFLI